MLDFDKGGFGCGRGGVWDKALRCGKWRWWGTAEEEELRDSEAVDKLRETGGIGMIIDEILCVFAYIPCPILFLPLELLSQPQIEYTFSSIGVALHRITTDYESGYYKVKFSEASWNKLNFGW